MQKRREEFQKQQSRRRRKEDAEESKRFEISRQAALSQTNRDREVRGVLRVRKFMFFRTERYDFLDLWESTVDGNGQWSGHHQTKKWRNPIWDNNTLVRFTQAPLSSSQDISTSRRAMPAGVLLPEGSTMPERSTVRYLAIEL